VEELHAENGVRRRAWRCERARSSASRGLVGAGRTELARAIFGADRLVSGEVRVLGTPVHGGPARLVAAGLGLVPEDRKRQGLALLRSVQDNLLVAALRKLFPRGWYRPAAAAAPRAS